MMHDTLAWHYFISATASRIALLVYKCAQFPLDHVDCMNTILSSHISNEHATSCLQFHSKPYNTMKYQVCDDITVYLLTLFHCGPKATCLMWKPSLSWVFTLPIILGNTL